MTIKITPKPRRMTVIVPSTVNAIIRIEAEKYKVKPYYLVSAALALWCGLCSVCGNKLNPDDAQDDILVRCPTCKAGNRVPDRVLARKEGEEPFRSLFSSSVRSAVRRW